MKNTNAFGFSALTLALAQAGASISASASALAAAVVTAADVAHACHLAICQLAEDSHSLTGKEAAGEEWNRSCAAFRAAMKRRGWILATDKKLYSKVISGSFPDATIVTRSFDTTSADVAAKAATDDAVRASAAQQTAECAVLTETPMFPSTQDRITDRANENGESSLLDTDIVTVQMTRREARDVAQWLAGRHAIANLPEHDEDGEVQGHLADLGLRATKLQAALEAETAPKPVSLTRVKGRRPIKPVRLSGPV
jgi:hypothetical protein